MSYINEGEAALEQQDYVFARKCFGYARRENPDDWRAWYGLARVVTRNFSKITAENWVRFLQTAIDLCTTEDKVKLSNQFSLYNDKIAMYKKTKESIKKRI